MEHLMIGSRRVDAAVTKLQPGREAAALEAMKRDGLDNVAFRVGGDTFVASAPRIDLAGVKEWASITLGGREGQVVRVDRESFDGRRLARWTGLGAAAGAATSALMLWGVFSMVSELPSILEFLSVAGIGGLVVGAATLGVACALRWWNGRQAQKARLAPFQAAPTSSGGRPS